jgi:hypothetical protein
MPSDIWKHKQPEAITMMLPICFPKARPKLPLRLTKANIERLALSAGVNDRIIFDEVNIVPLRRA